VISNKSSALTFPGAGTTVIGSSGKLYFAGGLTIAGSASTPSYSVGTSGVTGATMTIDCSKSNVFYTTLTNGTPVTTVTLSNPSEGQTINLFVTQPGTTPTTMVGTWAKWPGGTAFVLSTGTNAVDLIVATYRGGSWYATGQKAFA
jgi:hypothetical protein